MTDVMMAFGDFTFSISTAAYNELDRTTTYRWSQSDVVGARPAQQFIGQGNDEITLTGEILPHFRGGFAQMNRLRSIAAEGEPLFLVAGTGLIVGKYVVKEVQETQREFSSGGLPLHIRFTITLSRYEE